MKKITLFFAILMACGFSVLKAQTLNNPKDANGNMIFKWDCTAGHFATSNSFEIDQNVVFAVDVTGTPLEVWLTQSPTGFIRDIAFAFWTQWGKGPLDGRFLQIKGNIYGATLNFKQFIYSRQLQNSLLQGVGVGETAVTNALTAGTISQIYGTVFGFSYSPTDGTKNGHEWYTDAFDGIAMTTLPYTGTKTSAEFFNSDYTFFTAESSTWSGYAPPCASGLTAVKNTYVSDSPIVGYEYNSILGGKLTVKPIDGIFIQKALREDGSVTTTKVFLNK